MQVRNLEDPRLRALFGGEGAHQPGDVRPSIRLPRRGLPGWAIGAGLAAAALLLFVILESKRTAPGEPSTYARAADAPAFAPEPPPLYIPPVPPAPTVVVQADPDRLVATASPQPVPAPASTSVQPAIVVAPIPAPSVPLPPAPAPRATSGPPLVIDLGGGTVPPTEGENTRPSEQRTASSPNRVRRARASALANRSTTVVQGTLMPAVLETAFDSTRPGFARAIVSRNVYGFDGTRILVPRGSKLIGEYQSDVASGQKRAIISWTRIVRPDGTTMTIDSPAVDPLGRGGVRASVNTHFFERLKGALLHSTVQVGGLLATRSANVPLIITNSGSTGVPGAASLPTVQQPELVPTLRVPAGTSVSVFVAQDLDFGEAR